MTGPKLASGTTHCGLAVGLGGEEVHEGEHDHVDVGLGAVGEQRERWELQVQVGYLDKYAHAAKGFLRPSYFPKASSPLLLIGDPHTS